MADDTVTVASGLHLALRIHDIDPEADPAKPGLLPTPASAVINGNRHPDAVAGQGITQNVPRAMLENWLKYHGDYDGMVRIISDDEHKQMGDEQQQFGFEPELERVSKDAADAAGEGSTITDRHVSDTQMAATSNTPNDDSPRSQTNMPAGPIPSVVATPAAETPPPAPIVTDTAPLPEPKAKS